MMTREDTILHHAGIAHAAVQRMNMATSTVYDRDDMLSEAFIGLIEAVDSNNDTSAISTYATIRAKGRVIEAGRKLSNYSRCKKSAPRVHYFDDIDYEPVEDSYILSDLIQYETMRLLNDAINALPDRERVCIIESYQMHTPGWKIARILGVCESRVDQLKKQAILRLRQQLESIGLYD